ncbi:MAG: hypothetical protein SLAVMIC_00875 [uncultured marine phage]|uniref:Uncharacterized protein n=1 Tax=uncultured marine phage TaxID=707152 RepID=A0A8D9C9N5_9VIRU|nr:MAG: hypothetical protein SLAVMIC_00875 [uncultured marine phage]
MWMDILYIIGVALSQIIFNYLRTIEIKLMIKNKFKETMIVAALISVTWALSTIFTFKKVILDDEILILIIYLITGLYGKYLGLKEWKLHLIEKFVEKKKKKS